jgi:hypothetical protein
MESISSAVTGTEDQGNLTKPYRALVQFYDAFNRRDIVAIATNWAQNPRKNGVAHHRGLEESL